MTTKKFHAFSFCFKINPVKHFLDYLFKISLVNLSERFENKHFAFLHYNIKPKLK
jgi:hypothetical protein